MTKQSDKYYEKRQKLLVEMDIFEEVNGGIKFTDRARKISNGWKINEETLPQLIVQLISHEEKKFTLEEKEQAMMILSQWFLLNHPEFKGKTDGNHQ